LLKVCIRDFQKDRNTHTQRRKHFFYKKLIYAITEVKSLQVKICRMGWQAGALGELAVHHQVKSEDHRPRRVNGAAPV
jgi:hypothetical protein